MKVKVTINIDSHLLEEVRAAQINISATTEGALRAQVGILSGDKGSINLQVKLLELKREEKKLIKSQVVVTQLRELIEQVKQQAAAKEEKKIKEVQEKLEASTKCINCGAFLEKGKKTHTFNKGKVCRACYVVADGEAIKEWNDGKK